MLMALAIRKGFVLGAGLGWRLRPLTYRLPKPLLPIFGKPIITFALDHLRSIGIRDLAINTHHLSNCFAEFFSSGAYGDASLRLVEEKQLLETGGAIENVEGWIGSEPVMVYSGDLVSDLAIEDLVSSHFAAQNDVTLALRNTGLASPIAFDPSRQLVTDILGTLARPAAENLDFANVSIWSPAILERIPAGQKVSLARVLVSWISRGGKVGGVVLDEHQWFNISSRSDYFAVHRRIEDLKWIPKYLGAAWRTRIAGDAVMEEGAVLEGVSWVGPNSLIGQEACLRDCFVWSDAVVAPKTRLLRTILAGSRVCGEPPPDQDFGFA